jgi:hypothetical protein
MLYSHIIIQTRYLELKIQCLPVPTYKHNAKWTYSIAGRPGGKASQQTPECQSERDSTEEGWDALNPTNLAKNKYLVGEISCRSFADEVEIPQSRKDFRNRTPHSSSQPHPTFT